MSTAEGCEKAGSQGREPNEAGDSQEATPSIRILKGKRSPISKIRGPSIDLLHCIDGMDKMSSSSFSTLANAMEKVQGPDNLPAIPPEARPPTALVNETKFGDPYKFWHKISEATRPLLLADGGHAVPSDILPVIEKVHPLLLAHMKDLKDRNKRANRLDILLHQTCYTLTCQTPPRHHKMKEWSAWVPIPEEYDLLGPENAIGETEIFDATYRYPTRKEHYTKYKATWHDLDCAYKESVKMCNELIAAHKAAKRTREATELKAKQDIEAEKKKVLAAASQSKTSTSKGASETKVQSSARVIKDRQFRVQTQESMSQTKSPSTLKRPLCMQQTEPDSASKFPRLEGENSRPIQLAPLDSDESTFPIPFSFEPVVLSRALDLGPSRLIDEGLLKLKDPDVSPAFNRHGPTRDNMSSSELTNSKSSTPDTTEGPPSGRQESKDNSMVVEND
ncbi:hypothetical protein EDD18DRAFT_1098540 [Armillaria luteobubalina]|uniref:Uncharacterized protein n=1 Tax=Armillaria luteobubalina TaxID=153913 RepID=A0AA39QNF0_9AGAR|nr:hypothetical protein EDD18DRAFT_1098540 [Armillaria luteobubalina]